MADFVAVFRLYWQFYKNKKLSYCRENSALGMHFVTAELLSITIITKTYAS